MTTSWGRSAGRRAADAAGSCWQVRVRMHHPARHQLAEDRCRVEIGPSHRQVDVNSRALEAT